MTITLCRGCQEPLDAGFNWHNSYRRNSKGRNCLGDYRSSSNYRAATLLRDGAHCASCPGWWNDTVLSLLAPPQPLDPTSECPGCGKTHRHLLAPLARYRLLTRLVTRDVQADHIEALGSARGTHDPQNLQVLCQGLPCRHHPRKTKRDLAQMRGQRLPWQPTRAHLPFLLIPAAAWWVHRSGLSVSVLGLVALLALVLYGRTRLHTGVRRRLHSVYGQVTGASRETWRRGVRAGRWRLVRIDGYWLPRLRPRWQQIKYPVSFRDSEPEQQEKLEQQIVAKNGDAGGWVFTWNTQADRLTAISPDPLLTRGAVTWPHVNMPELSVWDPIPVGLDQRGRTVHTNLIGKNMLIGGEPEAGKSAAQSQITATFALDPAADLYLFDLKGGVEQAAWEPCAAAPMATTPADALELALHIRDLIDMRARLLRAESQDTGVTKRKFSRDDGMGPVGVVIDELAELTAAADKKTREALLDVIRSNISLGRFVGIIHVLATQRPSHEVVPTSIRDIISYRWAMRCTTPDSSDMILGRGQASLGYNAARVSPDARGVGFLHAEGGVPQRVRSFYLDDAEVDRLAGRAEALRKGARTQLLTAA